MCRRRRQRVHSRKWQLKNNYGLSIQDYDKLVQTQNGVCAICKGLSHHKNLDVDHDHKTKLVRGLLCQKCNKAIGLFNDDPVLIGNALTYLSNPK